MARRKNRSKKKKTSSQKQKSTLGEAKTIAADSTLPKVVNESGTSNERMPAEDSVDTGTQSTLTHVQENVQFETKGGTPIISQIKDTKLEVTVETEYAGKKNEINLAKEGQSKTDDTNVKTPDQAPDQNVLEAQNDEKKEELIMQTDNVSLVEDSTDGDGLFKEDVKLEEEEGPMEAETEKKREERVQIEYKTQAPKDAVLEVANAVNSQHETNSEMVDDNANMLVESQPEKEAYHTEKVDVEEMKESIIPIADDSETESESTKDDSVEAIVMIRDLDSAAESEDTAVDIVPKTPTFESQYVDCLDTIFSVFGLSRLIWEYWASPQATISAVETGVQSENTTGTDVALKI